MTPSRLLLDETQKNAVRSLFNGKSILVTGGTGSFGKAFIKRVLSIAKPKRMIVFSRDELKQYEMQHDLAFQNQSALRFFIGDVRDRQRIEIALRHVDYVVHAAALKQVPAAEYNPFECIKTNVIGAENIIEACLSSQVKKLVALSTDKACSPLNLYGASKLASDKLFLAANNLVGDAPIRFSVVRYGNVFGSRGSVVPFFANLIDTNAKALPITDPEVTRFIITLDQGVDFVLSSFLSMRGGEIFIPKIPSVKITDLARIMAPKLPQEIVGLRPGEKLHEAMITSDDGRYTVDLGDYYVIEPAYYFFQREPRIAAGYKAMDKAFHYESGTNTEWLSDATVSLMLNELGYKI